MMLIVRVCTPLKALFRPHFFQHPEMHVFSVAFTIVKSIPLLALPISDTLPCKMSRETLSSECLEKYCGQKEIVLAG
jgi:hypothetical protein